MQTPYKSKLAFVFMTALMASIPPIVQAVDDTAVSDQEAQLIAILDSDAPAADKAISCKKLSIVGTDQAVPVLAKLLPDQELCSWSLIALEAIPGAEADEALRSAAESLNGRLLIGVLNSIGARQDAGAVEVLISRLRDADADVAAAAAVALGNIGNPAAIESLRDSLTTESETVRSAVAEGCVLCAERLHVAGNSDAAVEIYDQVRQAELPKQRIVEATRGAILARGQNGLPLLLETLRSPDKKMFQLGLQTVREFPVGKLDAALVKEMESASPARAALLIQAMADRPDHLNLAAVLEAARQGDPQVRLSAIDAIGRVGDETSLPVLLAVAEDADAELSLAAQEGLAKLPGTDVDSQIVALLQNADGKRYALLLQLIGQRRIDAVSKIAPAVEHADANVRSAALLALGETVSLERLPWLISLAVEPKHSTDQPIAYQALQAASVRMPDREACAEELAKALPQAPAESQSTLLEILSEVGGTTSLQTLNTAAKSDNSQMQDTASRLLGKWNHVEAAPILLDLAQTAPAEKYRVRAIRGYIGLIRKFDMPEQQRVQMCRTALETAKRPADQQLVLDVMKLYPSSAMKELATDAEKIPGLKEAAAETTSAITKKL